MMSMKPMNEDLLSIYTCRRGRTGRAKHEREERTSGDCLVASANIKFGRDESLLPIFITNYLLCQRRM